jgi:hypothetical protein
MLMMTNNFKNFELTEDNWNELSKEEQWEYQDQMIQFILESDYQKLSRKEQKIIKTYVESLGFDFNESKGELSFSFLSDTDNWWVRSGFQDDSDYMNGNRIPHLKYVMVHSLVSNQVRYDLYSYDENCRLVDGGYSYSNEDHLRLLLQDSFVFGDITQMKLRTLDDVLESFGDNGLMQFTNSFFCVFREFEKGDIIYRLEEGRCQKYSYYIPKIIDDKNNLSNKNYEYIDTINGKKYYLPIT